MAIKIEMLKCFTTVVEQGNLSDAASTLGRTSSAVSMMLKQFEDHVGVPLFETGRKSKLTSLGTLIYEEARREVIHFENTVSVIEGLSKSEFGYLRLLVTPSIASTFLPDVIARFTKSYPGVQIDVRDMDSETITHELLRERADIGIGTFSATGDLTRTELLSDPFGVICSHEHPLAQAKTQIAWCDLAGHAFIANGLCQLIKDADFVPILAGSQMTVPSTTSLLGLVRAGVGISVLPQLAVSSSQDDIVFLPVKNTEARRTIHIAAQPQMKLMPAARAFLSLVAEMNKSDELIKYSNFSLAE